MTGHLDDQQQRYAAQVEHDHPNWVIMWGYHSRLYWAFPRFNAPQGTIVAAPSPAELTEAMRRSELAVAAAPRSGPAPPRPRHPGPPTSQPGPARPSAGPAFEVTKRAAGGISEPRERVG